MRLQFHQVLARKKSLNNSWLGLFLSISLLGSLWLMSCQTVDPPPGESILRLKLADSLSKYDLVKIDLIDPKDTNRILENVWSAPLKDPSRFSAHKLEAAKDKDFIVKVMGYAGGEQLLLQTLIAYIGGKKSVTHATVPPYNPRFHLKNITPSLGNLIPRFQFDSTQYRIIMPEGAAAVKLNLPPQFSGAKIRVNGQALDNEYMTSALPIGANADTLKVEVTDSSLGLAYTQEYRIIVLPSLPGNARLSSLKPSIGTLVPAFHPDSTTYSLYFPDTVTSVFLVPQTSEPSKTIMFQNGSRIFEGTPTLPTQISGRGRVVMSVEVRRGEETTFYVINTLYEQKP